MMLNVRTPALTQCRGGGFRFDRSTLGDDALGPVKRLLDRYLRIAVAAAVDDAAGFDTVGIFQFGIHVIQCIQPNGVAGVLVRRDSHRSCSGPSRPGSWCR